jgi:hypothetical protein
MVSQTDQARSGLWFVEMGIGLNADMVVVSCAFASIGLRQFSLFETSRRRRSAGRLCRSCGGGFRGEAAARATERFPILIPPFTPAAYWVCPDDRGIDGVLLVSWRPKTRQGFDLLQRVTRTKTEFQLPYRSRMPRQGAPVRRTHRTPLTIRRLSQDRRTAVAAIGNQTIENVPFRVC